MQFQEIIDYDIFLEKLLMEVNYIIEIFEMIYSKKILLKVNILTIFILTKEFFRNQISISITFISLTYIFNSSSSVNLFKSKMKEIFFRNQALIKLKFKPIFKVNKSFFSIAKTVKK